MSMNRKLMSSLRIIASGQFSKSLSRFSPALMTRQQQDNNRKVQWQFLLPFIGGAAIATTKVVCEDPSTGSEFRGLTMENLVEEPLKKFTGALQYPANINQEDRTISSVIPFGQDGVALYTVFDGHGGHAVSEFARNSIQAAMSNAIGSLKSPLPHSSLLALVPETSLVNAIKQAFLAIDNARLQAVTPFIAEKPARIGACALTVLVSPDLIVTANAGDCKAVLSRKGNAIALSNQHTAESESERDRLMREHPNEPQVVICKRKSIVPIEATTPLEKICAKFGLPVPGANPDSPTSRIVLSACYVKGRLQPTRALGDFHLKIAEAGTASTNGVPQVRPPYSFPYITAEPEVSVIKRQQNADEFVVLGSDGVWDFLSDQEAVDVIQQAIVNWRGFSKDKQSEMSLPDYAAFFLFEEVMRVAAKDAKVSVKELQKLNQGQRRSFHDDTTIVVAFLQNGLSTGLPNTNSKL